MLNADRIGAWDVAPRAHPNDGQLDVVEVDASMGLRDRWQASRRLATGTHVPHPAIHTATRDGARRGRSTARCGCGSMASSGAPYARSPWPSNPTLRVVYT